MRNVAIEKAQRDCAELAKEYNVPRSCVIWILLLKTEKKSIYKNYDLVRPSNPDILKNGG